MAKRRPTAPFVKAADTKTTVEKSRADLEKLLARYGATGFGYERDHDADRIVLRFVVPAVPGQPERVRVEMPLEVERVRRALLAQRKAPMDAAARQALDARAERVAWRQLHLFVDAALALVAINAMTLEEAFFAHTLLTTAEGSTGRAADFVYALRSAGQLRALPAGGRHA